MRSERSTERMGSRRGHGRPEVDVAEEQLSYMYQGFRTKDITIMFGCSRRTGMEFLT